MWILNFLPDWIFHAALVLGVLAIVISMFLQQFPLIKRYQTPLWLLGLILCIAGVWYSGGIAKDREYQQRISDLQVQIAQAEKRAAEANARVEYVYRDRVEVVEKIRYKVISAIRESSNALDANCQVIPEAVDILNQSARPQTQESQ